MNSVLSVAEDTEACANAARDAINARLGLVPEGELDFWKIVAKLYARGLKEAETEAAAEITKQAA